MTDACWIGAAPDPRAGGGTAAHLDAQILSALAGCGLDADLVCIHIDRTGPVAAVTVSARVNGRTGDGELGVLAQRLDGTVIALDAADTITVADRDPASIEAAAQAERAARLGRAGTDGRCLRFPGQASLIGVCPAQEIITGSAIDRVLGVGTPVTPDALVDTCGFLRPVYQEGHLVLLVEPAAGGVFRPVEIEQPHECCGGHHSVIQ
jgi:hypothetical protein